MRLCGLAAPRGRRLSDARYATLKRTRQNRAADLWDDRSALPIRFHQLESGFRGTCAEFAFESRAGVQQLLGPAALAVACRRCLSPRSAPPGRCPRPCGPSPPPQLSPTTPRSSLSDRRATVSAVSPLIRDGRHGLSSLWRARLSALLPLRPGQGGKDGTGNPIDIRFCSAEHQQLVRTSCSGPVLIFAIPMQAWPVHKAFCLERAFPVRLPRFRQEDADKVVGIFSDEAALRRFRAAHPGFDRDIQHFRKEMGPSVNKIKMRRAPPFFGSVHVNCVHKLTRVL